MKIRAIDEATPRADDQASFGATADASRIQTVVVPQTPGADTPKPRFLDRVRDAIRVRHYSRRTEKSYVTWIRRYILFHHKRHPAEMGAQEIRRFLTWLAVDGKVAAATRTRR